VIINIVYPKRLAWCTAAR